MFGFGEPHIESALYAGSNSGTYIHEGQLDTENYQYIKFHIPSLLAESNSDSKLKIKITFVCDPIVNPDNDIEYSCSRISLCLIKSSSDGNKLVNLVEDEKYNLPWNPIIKCEKIFSRSYSVGEWFLRLRLYTRNIKESDYKQNYAVVIEIIDDNKKVDVYNEIINEYGSIYRRIILINAA